MHHDGNTIGALRRYSGATADVLAIWREWSDVVSGHSMDASHFLAEDRPEELAAELTGFFAP
ncbi:MAG: hypothetical protein ACR2HC_01850 [Thermoleophilaceae bacterium]